MIDWAFPRKHLFSHPDPPDVKQLEPAFEAQYWVDLRETLGDLVIYSQLCPELPETDGEMESR